MYLVGKPGRVVSPRRYKRGKTERSIAYSNLAMNDCLVLSLASTDKSASVSNHQLEYCPYPGCTNIVPCPAAASKGTLVPTISCDARVTISDGSTHNSSLSSGGKDRSVSISPHKSFQSSFLISSNPPPAPSRCTQNHQLQPKTEKSTLTEPSLTRTTLPMPPEQVAIR